MAILIDSNCRNETRRWPNFYEEFVDELAVLFLKEAVKTNLETYNFNKMENLKKLHIKNIISNTSADLAKQQALYLHSAIQNSMLKNRSLLTAIQSYQPHFYHQLYRPQRTHGFDWEIEKEIKLREIDRLVQEEEYLAKKGEEMRMRKYFAELDDQNVSKVSSTQLKYEDMDNILSSMNQQSLTSLERIDQLNKAINLMKKKVECETNAEKVSLRKQNNQGPLNGYFPSKKYWKMHYKISQLQLQLKMLTKQNSRLRTLVQQKQDLLLKAGQQRQTLQQQLRSSEKKLQKLEKIINSRQNSQINQMQAPAELLYEFRNIQQGFYLYMHTLKKEYNNESTTNKKITQICEFLSGKLRQQWSNSNPIESGEMAIQYKQGDTVETKGKTVEQIRASRNNQEIHANLSRENQKVAIPNSILRNCQSHPIIGQSDSSQILDIENLCGKQNMEPVSKAVQHPRFRRRENNKKQGGRAWRQSYI